MKQLRNLKKWVADFSFINQKVEELEVLIEFEKSGDAKSIEVIEAYEETIQLFEDLEFRNMLSEEGDDLSAVLQITAGAGGTESCDWAEMLMRMYIMWGEKQGFNIREINHQSGDVAGIKTVTLELNGDYAFGWLKGENGVHRLVRISPFDSNAKRHTSFASVYVYPLVDDTIQIDINPADIQITTPAVQYGEHLEFSIAIKGLKPGGNLMVDYIVHFMKANGTSSPKVFKWMDKQAVTASSLHATRRHTIKPITTRKYYPGTHRLELLVNGVSLGTAEFELLMP